MKDTGADAALLKPLDPDVVERQFNISDRIAERSSAGPEANEYDIAFANELAARLGDTIQTALKDVRRRLNNFHDKVTKAVAGHDFEEEKNEIQSLLSEQRVAIGTITNDLDYAHKQFLQTASAFDAYRAKRKLVAPATKAQGTANIFAFLTILVVAEAFFNMLFLAPVDPEGPLWGGITAVLISIINVTIGFGVGYGLKYLRSALPTSKMVGLSILFIGIPFITLCHYIVMKYRSEMSLLGEQINAGSDYMGLSTLLERTIQSIINTPLLVNDFNSLIIFIVGLILSALALIKGYTLGDSYPGYTNEQAKFEVFREQFVGLRNEHVTDLETLKLEAIAHISRFIRDADAGKKIAINYANDADSLLQSYRTFEQSVQATSAAVIGRYVSPLKPSERTRVSKLITERVAEQTSSEGDLADIARTIRNVSNDGAESARNARELADALRAETIATIDARIEALQERYKDEK
ncbi:hypothetical protein [Maricaulis sp.]|uniref:hypothetical protein n=1 Tax=Maricaulis sp. TaxID=1486257 RepID=UPI003A8E12E5